jgi:hypothetical protein
MPIVCSSNHANETGSLFCEHCGEALDDTPPARLCPQCGSPNQPADTRCTYCGAALEVARKQDADTRPRLIVLATGAVIDLSVRPEYLIGRADPTCDIFPDIDLTAHGGEDGGVSRTHARLRREATGWTIEDQRSVNFTFLNKQQLKPLVPVAIKSGDELRLGRVVLRFEIPKRA